MSDIPRRVLLAYAALSFPLAGTLLVVQVMVPSYYAGTLGIGLSTLGAILMAARVLDTVTDPIVGYISDRTPARYGRRRIWIVVGMPFLMISMLAIFIPKEGSDAWSLLLWTSVLYVSGTLVIVPMNAWGAELSDDYHQRTRVTTYRAMFGLAGILAVLLIPVLTGWGGVGAEQMALMMNAAILGVGFAVALGIVCAFVPDRSRVVLQDQSFKGSLSIFKGARSFQKLFLAFFFNAVANSIPAALCIFYVTHILQDPESVGLLLVLYFTATALSSPIWAVLAKRCGKCVAWRMAMLMGASGLALTPLLGPGDLMIFCVVCVWTGLAGGADVTLPSALLGDQVEADEFRTGTRRAGIFYAWWGTASKLSFAVAAGICFPALDLVAFNAAGDNNGIALSTLSLLYGVLPVGLKLAAYLLLIDYPLTRSAYDAMREKLALQRNVEPSSAAGKA